MRWFFITNVFHFFCVIVKTIKRKIIKKKSTGIAHEGNKYPDKGDMKGCAGTCVKGAKGALKVIRLVLILVSWFC